MSSAAAAAAAGDNPQAGQGRPLPKKEADLFKNVVKFYELKQYKKGLKNADAVLKRFPNHGETLCMKGLIVNAMASALWGGETGAAGAGAVAGAVAGAEKKEQSGPVVDRKKEAVELVKKGLMMDMRSHVCWHVYGLLHRSSHNYAEAIKAYKQALRIDNDNLQILRDMGLLQIQMRDLTGFRDTRLRILTLRPNQKLHWLTYAMALHVGGDPNAAVGVLDSYMNTLGNEGPPSSSNNTSIAALQNNFENSELALYKNMILSETTSTNIDYNGLGGIRKALDHLDAIHDVVVDMTGWHTARLSYQLQLGLYDDAEETAMKLFLRGSTEDHRVHGAYMCALLKCDANTCREVLEESKGTATLATLRPLAEEERAILMKAYYGASATTTIDGESQGSNNGYSSGISTDGGAAPGGLASAFPTSASIQRIRLTLLSPSSAEFKLTIDKYCQRQIIKGVPSLGSDLSSLYLMEKHQYLMSKIGSSSGELTHSQVLATTRYVLAKDPVDVKIHGVYRLLVELIDSYILTLSSSNAFPNDATTVAPSALLWSWYQRSILHEQAGEYSQGISLINKCIDHTPTAVDFYELKSRLLESGGDIQQAADVVDIGRDLDHQDRYINNQTTKTLLRAGRIEEASKRISLFTRHEAPVEQNLYDMQCTWYELELADCLKKKGELGRSLRKYMAVAKHYEDYQEDQFDFHNYCIRKCTLRSYSKLLKFEDELWGLPHYCRAAEGIISIHLHLSDNAANSQADDELDYSEMTPAERKKAKNMARKKKKTEGGGGGGDVGGVKDSVSLKTNAESNGNKKKFKPHIIDEDPEGKELLALDHLELAKKFAAILVRHAPRRISAWALQYDVSIRRGKMLLAMQTLFKMKSINSDDHGLFTRIIDFSQKMSSRSSKGHVASEQVLSSEFPELTNRLSMQDFIQLAVVDVKTKPMSNLLKVIAVAAAMFSTKVGSSAEASSLLLDSKLNLRGVTIAACREALVLLKSLGTDKENKEQLMKLIISKFPFAKDL